MAAKKDTKEPLRVTTIELRSFIRYAHNHRARLTETEVEFVNWLKAASAYRRAVELSGEQADLYQKLRTKLDRPAQLIILSPEAAVELSTFVQYALDDQALTTQEENLLKSMKEKLASSERVLISQKQNATLNRLRTKLRFVSKSENPNLLLNPAAVIELRMFIRYALGDGRLTSWEENFLNDLKYKVYRKWLIVSQKQAEVINQLRDKLHFDRPDDPLPPLDPDGIVENDDPDGYPVVAQVDFETQWWEDETATYRR